MKIVKEDVMICQREHASVLADIRTNITVWYIIWEIVREPLRQVITRFFLILERNINELS